MPAAAVIPAPIAYIKAAAVKKLVVGSRGGRRRLNEARFAVVAIVGAVPPRRAPALSRGRSSLSGPGGRPFTLKKLECSRRARCARIIAHGMMEQDRRPVRPVSGAEVMIERDGRGHSYRCGRGEIR